MNVFTFDDVDSGQQRAYTITTEPGDRCLTCQGLWGRTFHPATRPCAVVPPQFYATAHGALRLRTMFDTYGNKP